MQDQSDELRDNLARSSEITIHVIGRKSGRAISVPIWFVLDDHTVCLLPVNGSDTHWYKNVLKNASMRIEAGDRAEVKAVPVREAAQVKSVIEKFRSKYGAG